MTNRFKLMKVNEQDGLRFIHQTLRDYFAAIYMKNNNLSPDDILKLVYTDSVKNADIVNAVRLLASIVMPQKAKDIILIFISKDPYLACSIFAYSFIVEYDETVINLIRDEIDIDSREYLLNVGEVILFYTPLPHK